MLLKPLLPTLLVAALSAGSIAAPAQSERHGRKYKAPPETSHLEILVLKAANGKVIENAAVIFHPVRDGIDEGNLEVKSGVDGKAFIDIIPTGSDVAVQVIAGGFTTYAGHIVLKGPSEQLTVKMARPVAQVSAYDENGGTDAPRKVGVQEPPRRTQPAANPKPLAASEPVLKLPTLPKNASAKGDTTVPADHNVTPPPAPPVKPPNESSAPLGTTVDGTASGSPSNP